MLLRWLVLQAHRLKAQVVTRILCGTLMQLSSSQIPTLEAHTVHCEMWHSSLLTTANAHHAESFQAAPFTKSGHALGNATKHIGPRRKRRGPNNDENMFSGNHAVSPSCQCDDDPAITATSNALLQKPQRETHTTAVCPVSHPSQGPRPRARYEPSAASSSVPLQHMEAPIINDDEVAPFSRPVVQCSAGDGIKFWFTFFGVVEVHQVLQRMPEWGEQQCVQEAIFHSAPALTRPQGRVIQHPLPGLYRPQVVLTRMEVHSPFRTVVFDMRPVGADLRAEDVRLHRHVADVFREKACLHL